MLLRLLLLFFLSCSLSGLHAQDEVIPIIPEGQELKPLQKDDVVARQPEAASVRRLKADEAYWYAEEGTDRNEEIEPTDKGSGGDERGEAGLPERRKSSNRQAGSFLTWLIIGLLLVVLAWFLISGNRHLFRRAPVSVKEDAENFENEDLLSLPFEARIREAESKEEYAQAVRLRYLQTLHLLHQKGLIEYSAKKTNASYLQALRPSALYRSFFHLTRQFEYIWYGQQPLDRMGYTGLATSFEKFKTEAA